MNEIEDKLANEFREIGSDLQRWGRIVDGLLTQELFKEIPNQDLIKIAPSFRLKSEKSYLYKVLYRNKIYAEPLLEVEDKVGTRVVVLKSDQIDLIGQRVLSYEGWIAKITKEPLQQIEDQPKMFDYQSLHIVVYPVRQEEWSSTKKEILTCEIQIRTLLQHAFAEVSHDSTYKGAYRNDSQLHRLLAKSMALMESTDDYFCQVYNLMADERRNYMVLTNELIKLYKEFDPEFSKSSVDYDLTFKVYESLGSEPINVNELEAFIHKENKDLKRAIRPKNGLLFEQPIILLIAYFVYNNDPAIKEKWPLTQDSLKNVYNSLNMSFDHY
ncbi:hypothetical protein SAMN05444008_11271 [Cnuella takakiae]|uniref:RelA/SpoT domain-containing protein n=1 Tax=Cnuella takakiae TaxID=1302690 RepID=A0A1M5EJV2_9BACT|nr:RelA/SpoT domain-containing protein [Cnuella takakiae]OLY91197.1 hypothetical protein BUE76_04255 [Cnuella takakiae]SHF79351.1 hypothetical protein SAMN05444008_11271 [Cnuella takakiae]